MKIRSYLITLLLVLLSGISLAEERIRLKSTQIIGNKELPKMLYIVPWKNPQLPDMDVPPIESLIDEALSPVDRDNFRRTIRYYQIYSDKNKKQNENQ